MRVLLKYFPRNWEFGSALSKLQNFRRVLTPETARYTTALSETLAQEVVIFFSLCFSRKKYDFIFT
jgi:hypothetical protein